MYSFIAVSGRDSRRPLPLPILPRPLTEHTLRMRPA
jgi:hypothetical protein